MRHPTASATQIVAHYQEHRNMSKLMRELHCGGDRAERILSEAGVELERQKKGRGKRKRKRAKPKIPQHYIEAIAEYKNGMEVAELKKHYKICYAQFYRWLDRRGVPRRISMEDPKEYRCWECGAAVPYEEIFCCDQHRLEYAKAALAPGFKPPRQYRREAELEPCQSTA